jgi:hypothetical protein
VWTHGTNRLYHLRKCTCVNTQDRPLSKDYQQLLSYRSRDKEMKIIIIINTICVAASASISWFLIEWTRSALLKSQQGLLPLPAFTRSVFSLQYALVVPVAVFALVALFLTYSTKSDNRVPVLIVTLMLATIIITSASISVACLLPWFPRIP